MLTNRKADKSRLPVRIILDLTKIPFYICVFCTFDVQNIQNRRSFLCINYIFDTFVDRIALLLLSIAKKVIDFSQNLFYNHYEITIFNYIKLVGNNGFFAE